MVNSSFSKLVWTTNLTNPQSPIFISFSSPEPTRTCGHQSQKSCDTGCCEGIEVEPEPFLGGVDPQYNTQPPGQSLNQKRLIVAGCRNHLEHAMEYVTFICVYIYICMCIFYLYMRYVYTYILWLILSMSIGPLTIFEDTNMQRKNGTPFLDVHKGIANKTEVSPHIFLLAAYLPEALVDICRHNAALASSIK